MAKLWSTEDLVTHTFPTPAYLVEPIIPQGGIVILHGKPNVGKTQLIITLAEAINSGTPLFGRWPTRQGSVVVVQADMTGPIQQDRVAKASTAVDLSRTYWVAEEDGSIPLINIITLPLTKKDLVAAIKAANPALIVWDTLRKIHRLPENDSLTAVEVFAAARAICPAATHIFVHHNRKESRDPEAPEDTDEAFMGNQQWKGAADTTISLKELGTSPKRVLMEIHKARTAADPEKHPTILELDLDTMLLHPIRRHAHDPGAPAALAETYR